MQAKDTIILTITLFQSMQYCIAIILLKIKLFKKRDSVNEKSINDLLICVAEQQNICNVRNITIKKFSLKLEENSLFFIFFFFFFLINVYSFKILLRLEIRSKL